MTLDTERIARQATTKWSGATSISCARTGAASPRWRSLAARNNMSAAHLQRLFTRWAGLSPKAFLQALTIDHARKLLRDSATVLDTAYEVGLSGPGRLHDLFVTHEGMTPGVYKARGRGLTIQLWISRLPLRPGPHHGDRPRASAAWPSPIPARSRRLSTT